MTEHSPSSTAESDIDTSRILGFYRVFQLHMGRVHYDSPLLVGWSSKEEQLKRFQTLIGIGIESGDSLLDYGCGMAHLLSHLHKTGRRVRYHGIDISPEYVQAAARQHPTARFSCCDIDSIDERYDWIVGSGVFTVGIRLPAILDRIDHAYRQADKGIAFNFLNESFNNSGAQHYFNTFNSQDMQQRLSERYPNVTLVEGYIPQDFTLFVKK